MAKYIYNKYNANAEITYTWRQYNVKRSYIQPIANPVEEQISIDYYTRVYNSNGEERFLDNISDRGEFTYNGLRYLRIRRINVTGSVSGSSRTWHGVVKQLEEYARVNQKGTYRGTVTSTSSTAYPTNGISGSFWYDTRTSSTSYSRGSYIGQVTAEDGTYPVDGRASDGYWYVRQGLANTAPSISGSDLDLGAKVDNFQIEYIVTDNDPGDEVSVEIRANNNVIQDFTKTSLGIKRFIDIDLDNYDLGKHTITITARDKAGLTATRVYVFTKTNTAPEISSTDTDLGAKNTPFSITYQVRDREGDSVTVYEKINGDILKTRNNVTLDSDLTITVTAEMLQELEVGKINTIEIEASDGKGGIAYRRFTFHRSNFAPVISGTDTDLGDLETEFNYDYSATDEEKDAMTVTVYFDGNVWKPEIDLIDGETQSLSITGFDFLKIMPGKHTIRIEVKDDIGNVSERLITFTRVATRLIMQQETPFITDTSASKVLIIPSWDYTTGTTQKVEVCNNALDDNPTWEDATSMTLAGKAFNFQNTIKTATDWAVDSRLTINLEDGTPLKNFILGWGMSYE